MTAKTNDLDRSIPQNPRKATQSLRDSGYKEDEAIGDIVDNSFDAGAKTVKIVLNGTNKVKRKTDKVKNISILDDGKGMDLPVLRQAFVTGADTEHQEDDLGKFGFGLKTASTSIGRCITVTTKEFGKPVYIAVYDIDHICETNRFELKELREASKKESKEFVKELSSIASKSGTKVVISKIDRIKSKTEVAFDKKVRNYLQETFRKILLKNVMFLNNEKLEPFDPFAIVEDEKTFKVSYKKHTIKVRAVYLEASDDRYNKITSKFGQREPNQSNQGFYVMRNNRQIASAQGLGILKKHNRYNRLRMEISMSTELDSAFGIDFKKNSVSLDDDLAASIKEKVMKWVDKKVKIAKEKQIEDRDLVKDFKDSEDIINSNREQFIRNSMAPKKRSLSKASENNSPNNRGTGATRGKYKSHKNGKGGLKVVFHYSNDGLNSSDYTYEVTENKKYINIYLNKDHPTILMYMSFKDNGNLTAWNAVLQRIYSEALGNYMTMEETEFSDETRDFFEEQSSNVSKVLRSVSESSEIFDLIA